MQLPIHTIATAPPDSRDVLAGIERDLGVLPNLAAAAASSPALLRGFNGMRRAVATASLSPALREIAGLTTGVEVDNRYGIAFHGTMLDRLGVAGGEADAIRDGKPPSDGAAAAVHAFVIDAVQQRGRVADDRVEALGAVGLGREAVLEILLEVAFASLVGLVDNLAGHVQVDEFLLGHA